jgi:nucleotide-binding universal stress UspA family protein
MPGKRHSVFQHILVGFDGSDQSKKAAATAIGLARCLDARILTLAVARPPEPATSVELEAVLDDAKEHFEQPSLQFERQPRMRMWNYVRTWL